jgi:hypothetical protein
MTLRDLLEFRSNAILAYGARTLDVMIAHFLCPRCHQEVSDTAVRAAASVVYTNLPGVIRWATGCASKVTANATCIPCGRGAKLVHVDYHLFHTGENKDLVVRWFPKASLFGRARHELGWFVDGDFHAVDSLAPDAQRILTRDALLRSAQTASEIEGVEAALPRIAKAAEQLAGERDLLDFVPILLEAGRAGLASQIVGAHIEKHPDDPAGYFGMANIIIQVVTHGAAPEERLSEAARYTQRALELQPEHLGAQLAKGTIMRMLGHDDAAQHCYRVMIERDPECAQAHYNLAKLLLEADPDQAAKHFAVGEKHDPQDPDYPIGLAFALAKAGHIDKAREALERARELTPDHPAIPQVEEILPG